MMREVIVRPEAANDIQSVHAWYRDISPQFATAFIRRIVEAITHAREWPLMYQLVYRDFRRVPLRRFPYALFYRAYDERIVVVAVLHQVRDPQLIESRLDGES
jgi:plasmid stabilization system protein ParE